MADKVPAIPEVHGIEDAAAAAVLGPVKETLEIRQGRRGDPLERFVTVRELIDWGLVDEEQAKSG